MHANLNVTPEDGSGTVEFYDLELAGPPAIGMLLMFDSEDGLEWSVIVTELWQSCGPHACYFLKCRELSDAEILSWPVPVHSAPRMEQVSPAPTV